MLRRRATPTSTGSTALRVGAGAAQDSPIDLGKPSGKGRPTPRRSDSQKQRKQAVRPPANSKEARAQARDRLRDDRVKRAEGLKRGDDSSLPARDRGPVRRYVRNVVDSRLNASEFFMVAVFFVVILSVIRPIAPIASFGFAFTLVAVVVDSLLLRARILRRVAAKFPPGPGSPSTKGAVLYGIVRSLQFRRLRLPKPAVKRGAVLD